MSEGNPPPLSRLDRLLAASSFAFLIGAALLVYSAYKERAFGASTVNVLRLAAAVILVALAVKGTRLRHRRSE